MRKLSPIFLLLLSPFAFADVTLPKLLSDGMILQRDTQAVIWGWADDGEVVDVYLDSDLVASATATDGSWKVHIAAQAAGGPHQIRIAGSNTLVVDDVWFGDVWIASGQSNMDLMMERVKEKFPDEIATANLPLIRHFKVAKQHNFKKPQTDVGGGSWQAATPESVMNFSAVGFFFAKALQERIDVPIGIINNAYGGSAAESWMSEQALEEYPHYLKIARQLQDDDYLQGLIDSDQAAAGAWYGNIDSNDEGLKGDWSAADLDDAGWHEMNVPGYWAQTDIGSVNGVVWFRKTIELPESVTGLPGKLMLGRVVDADTTYVNGVKVGNTTYKYPPRRYELPEGLLKAGSNTIAIRVVNSAGEGGFIPDKDYWLQVGEMKFGLEGRWRANVGTVSGPIAAQKFVAHRQPLGFYNAMLAPLLNTRIKGVIWYQGETNAGRPDEYVQLFPAMIRNWREDFGQGDFPFIYVQLANYMKAYTEPRESDWAKLREAQRLTLSEANTAMAVAIDVGEWNDIHPLDKKTVGERVALAARAVAYGESGLVSSGPTLRSFTVSDGTAILEFDNKGSGLVVQGDELQEFAIAGTDGVFHWAKAIIVDQMVLLKSDAVQSPVAVRYAWADNPSRANLFNAEGLPASPFEATLKH